MLFCLEKEGRRKEFLLSDVMTCTDYIENLSCANCGSNYQLLNVLCMCVRVCDCIWLCLYCVSMHAYVCCRWHFTWSQRRRGKSGRYSVLKPSSNSPTGLCPSHTLTASQSSASQGYKDVYLPVMFKCMQQFVLVTFHSYSALTNRQNITISRV